MGQYGIHRVEKIKAAGIGGIERENTREREYPGSDIIQNRTMENLILLDETNGKRWQEYVNSQITAAGCRVRKDSVKSIQAIYTASPEYLQGLSRDQQLQYFQDCLKWHEKTYGKPFYAIVHMDEKTPHMHVTGIPLLERDGKIVLSAKECLGGRQALAEKQESFYREICEPSGLDHHHVREPHQQRQHLDSIEYKIQQEEQRLREQIERLLPEPDPGKGMVEYRQSIVGRLLQRDEVIISRTDLEQLQRQAALAAPLAKDRDQAIRKAQSVTREQQRLYREATEAAEKRLEQLQQQGQRLEHLLRQKSPTEPLEQLQLCINLVDQCDFEDTSRDFVSQAAERARVQKEVDSRISESLESILRILMGKSLDMESEMILEGLRSSQKHQKSKNRDRGISR